MEVARGEVDAAWDALRAAEDALDEESRGRARIEASRRSLQQTTKIRRNKLDRLGGCQ